MTKDRVNLKAKYSLSEKRMVCAENIYEQGLSIEDCAGIVRDRRDLKGLRTALSKNSLKINKLVTDNTTLHLENERLEVELDTLIRNTKALKLSAERLSSERGRWLRKLKRAGLL